MENRGEKVQAYTEYCLNCKNKSCKQGCPLENDIPSIIDNMKKKDFKKAYEILTSTSVLSSICGRICPHQKQCQGNCIRGIKSHPVSIGEIESFLGDMMMEEDFYKISNELEGKKIAIVGSGPSGLTCAAFLARRGADVTIYEKQEKLGGILRYGIPDFRLDEDILEKSIQKIMRIGIKQKTNTYLGKDITLENLNEKYDSVYLAFGANCSSFMGIEGKDKEGVIGGNELLEDKKYPDFEGKTVCVIGGGNVAIDTARTVKKLGAKEVNVVYRRAREQMPAEQKEIEDAIKEDVKFLFQTNILKIMGDKKVSKIECIKTMLVKKDGEDRKVPVNVEGSNFLLETDHVIMAIGSHPENKIIEKLRLDTTKYGYIKVDENYMTSKDGIFAGGDLIGQKATIAWASRYGREAAEKIGMYITKK